MRLQQGAIHFLYLEIGPILPLKDWPRMLLFYAVGIAEDAVTIYHRGRVTPEYRMWALGMENDGSFRLYWRTPWRERLHYVLHAFAGIFDSCIALPTLGLVRPLLREWVTFGKPCDWLYGWDDYEPPVNA